MNTPICDFLESYVSANPTRLHMPGHKGKGALGFEKYDITEIDGADSLYSASGIIAESEKNAAELFGTAKTAYSTEGSSQCIRAMLYLALLAAKVDGRKPVIVAARNAHKSFVLAAALLDFDVVWLKDDSGEKSLCRSKTTPFQLHTLLKSLSYKPAAVYITSPDYLGNTEDIESLSEVAHSFDTLLIVDNAHGAYLKFLKPSLHPIDLGADICCDSAHKTLPVLTGGAYLHVSNRAPLIAKEKIKGALALFGSTSPSYLTLYSLDKANKLLADGLLQDIAEFAEKMEMLRLPIRLSGWKILDTKDVFKLTICAKESGFDGKELSHLLEQDGLFADYAEPDYVVFMLTPSNDKKDILKIIKFFSEHQPQKAIAKTIFKDFVPTKSLSMREALFSISETIETDKAVNRVLASPTVSCPPAVPILVGGEVITKDALDIFRYYGIKEVEVVK